MIAFGFISLSITSEIIDNGWPSIIRFTNFWASWVDQILKTMILAYKFVRTTLSCYFNGSHIKSAWDLESQQNIPQQDILRQDQLFTTNWYFVIITSPIVRIIRLLLGDDLNLEAEANANKSGSKFANLKWHL